MKSIRPAKKRGRPGSSFRTNDRCLYIIYTQAWLADPIRSDPIDVVPLRIGKTKGRNDRILLRQRSRVGRVQSRWLVGTGGYEPLVSRSMPRCLMSLIKLSIIINKGNAPEMAGIDFNGIPRNATRRNMLLIIYPSSVVNIFNVARSSIIPELI